MRVHGKLKTVFVVFRVLFVVFRVLLKKAFGTPNHSEILVVRNAQQFLGNSMYANLPYIERDSGL